MIAASSHRSATRGGRGEWVSLVVTGLRPRQWTKNLLLFAGLLFAARLGDAVSWVEAIAGFALFCAASGAAYLVNDVRDAERDRLHPAKRLRPVASGALPPRTALAVAALLAGAALAAGAALGARFELLLSTFLVLQLAYTLRLKTLAVVDVATIGACFVLRAAAGAAALQVRISPWLLACTALLALVLGFAKRRAELVRIGPAQAGSRPVLRRYSLALLDRLVASFALATIAAFLLYVLAAPEQRELAPTLPFVAVGIGRYLWLARSRGLGEEPEQVLLADAGIRSAVVLWTLASALILMTA